MSEEVFRQKIESFDHRLGRHIEHDPKSKAYALLPPAQPVDQSRWRSKSIRIYDPTPNPNQSVGNCTMCAKAMQLNAVGNRLTGVVLKMDWALKTYVWETHNDEYDGAWNLDGSGEDTGSSGLASCKTVQHTGEGGEYRWILNGAAGVVQAVQQGMVVSVGTNWRDSMFTNHYSSGKPLEVTGDNAGGHEWIVRGWDNSRRYALGRCWWGEYRDFWIRYEDLDMLLLGEQGDAHVQARTRPAT